MSFEGFGRDDDHHELKAAWAPHETPVQGTRTGSPILSVCAPGSENHKETRLNSRFLGAQPRDAREQR